MKKNILVCAAIVMCSTALTFAGNGARVIIPGDHFPTSFRMDPNLKEEDYLPNTVILKVKKQYSQNCKVNSIDNILRIQDLLNSIGSQNFAKIYPNHKAPEREFNEVGLKLVDLSLIYSFKYTSNVSLEKVINQFLALGYFEFVEPWYIPKTQFVPNDAPGYTSQYHLQGNVIGSVDTQGAWNTQKGNPSVVIGIVDTGTEPTHPDLAANYLGGYDVAMKDNDPTWQGSDHGCGVSGDACAVTNNGIGVAGPGYNCKYKCAKVADAAGKLTAGYEGITWAADNGCKIINCSWGGPGGGMYGQTVIDYAIINKNCLLVMAAGNNAKDELFYPSSYLGVYRVAATTNKDTLAVFSNYGSDVDYGSPGYGIYSTTKGTGYTVMHGTSMASPVSAGVAGLIQSQFNYTDAQQIGERMKQTCDPYFGTNTLNLFNAGKLGKGRIDAARAVNTLLPAKSLVMNPVNITDGNDNVFMPAEVLTVSGTFINYLDPSSASASAALSVISGPGTITNGNCTIGALATLGTNSSATPFKVSIQAGAAVNAVIKFKVTITDGAFSGDQYFEIIVNPDYINIINNDVHTSITSKGRIGFNLDQTQQGLGFEYQLANPPAQMLYEMSLMIGSSSTAVSDMFRETTSSNTDFISTTRAVQVTSSALSDFDVQGKFTDAASPNPVPVAVHHSAYAWSTAPYRKFVIVKYVIKNTSSNTLNNVAVGIVADWDIGESSKNKGNYDAINKMGYCYDASNPSSPYAGIKLLTSGGTPNNYILDNVTGGNGGIDVSKDYLTAEKYQSMTTSRIQDGYPATGGDVMDCMSTYGLSINAGDSITVAFALIGGDNLIDLQTSACAAQNKYDNGCALGTNDLESDNFWMYNYPNPGARSFNIDYNIVGYDNASIRIINPLGEMILSFENLAPGRNTLKVDASKFSSGTYFYQLRSRDRIKSGEAVLTKKLTIAK